MSRSVNQSHLQRLRVSHMGRIVKVHKIMLFLDRWVLRRIELVEFNPHVLTFRKLSDYLVINQDLETLRINAYRALNSCRINATFCGNALDEVS